MRTYTNPTVKGDLLEADACQAVFTELERLCKKYERKVAKEQAKRESDLEIATGYACESDIHNYYGWGFITEQQYECYLDLFRGGVSAL